MSDDKNDRKDAGTDTGQHENTTGSADGDVEADTASGGAPEPSGGD